MDYEPLPSAVELSRVAAALGRSVSFERRILGGQSSTTDILVADDGQRVVLRRHGKWSIGFDDGIATREEAVLRAVAASEVAAPRVLWSGQLGPVTAIITEFVEGVAIIRPSDPLRWASQLATALAGIHSVVVDGAVAAILKEAPLSPVDLASPDSFASHPYGMALLARRAALSPTVGSGSNLVHGDYWPGNLLWQDDQIVAVLDWEAAVLGDPAGDVAYCLAEMRYLGLDDAADHFLAHYRATTGSELKSLPYWMVTALCRAVPELDSYLDGWGSLGYAPEPEVVRRRFERLVKETLSN